MICHFCKLRFAFRDDPGKVRDEDERKIEFELDDEAVCAECDKKFQG